MLKKIVNKTFRMLTALVTGIFWYTGDFFAYSRLRSTAGENSSLKFFPKIFDKNPKSHTFDKHYVYMDKWAFEHVLHASPAKHVDVGSSIRFLSMASSVTPVEFVDIRPISVDFANFSCITGSILSMPYADNSLQSLSCLHVAEHIGLGRYGDPLDPEGTRKACKELARVLAPGGRLYFALPVGKQATYFNAHRVHNPQTILDYFSAGGGKNLRLEEFAAVGDNGHFTASAKPEDFATSQYACGMFVFSKP